MEESGTYEASRANRVRALREERLMSREELAKRARVSLRTIWSVESGHECRLETKRAILRALRISRKQYRVVFPASANEALPETAAPVGYGGAFDSASRRFETA
jgi:DNA-binding XRE family transcriptional regulator